MAVKKTKKKTLFRLYKGEASETDIIDEGGFGERLVKEFGERTVRGAAIGIREDTDIINVEQQFRDFLRPLNIKHAVEIGTFRGVSAAVIAHYADKVTTIDLIYSQTAVEIWWYFGVKNKIDMLLVDNDNNKKKVLEKLDFDFAFIDGSHEFEDVAFDFEQVKKCGRVLFHDYDMEGCPGPTELINTLPVNEVIKKRPFAYWESSNGR